jgi:hypothetical protein
VRSFDSFDNFVIKGLGEGILRNHLLFLPQSEFVLHANGKLAVDFVGRYERLESDFRIVAEKLGIQSDLPMRNKTQRKREDFRTAYIKTDSIAVIGEIYKQDLKAFNYAFR